MKRLNIFVWIILFFSLISFSVAQTNSCSLSVSLLNQDPYPAIPGDYVKLVFQVDGLENPLCGDLTFELLEEYPIQFDPNATKKVSVDSGTFVRDYASHSLIPYKVRVDSNAIDGDNPVDVIFSTTGNLAQQTKTFNLFVEDTRADFEIYIKNYDSASGALTLEVLNIAKVSVDAITLELKKQNVTIIGANTKIIGDLDSNEYTTADFNVKPKNGDNLLSVKIHYTDDAGFRRTTEESVLFDSSIFPVTKSGTSGWKIFWVVVVLGAIVWFVVRKIRKKRK